MLPLSDGWRTGAGVLIAAGVVVAAGVLVATLRSAGQPAPGDDTIEPTTPEPNDGGDLVGASAGRGNANRR